MRLDGAFADTAESIARVAPVTETFTFQSADDFEAKARDGLLRLVPQVPGQRFHVRMHRCGWREKLGESNEEQFLDSVLLEALKQTGVPAEVNFEDPDFIIDVESLDSRAGLALWTREDLHRYSFLKLD